MQLALLEPRVPQGHEDWSDEEYAGRIVVLIGCAGNRYLDRDDSSSVPAGLQPYLVEGLVLAIEWAHRRGWPLASDFGLRLDWQNHSFLYMVLRTGEALSGTHWAAVHDNPARAMEQLNFAIGCLVDYCRWRGWPVEAEAARAIRGEDS